jgi:putative phage-type endonuclease
MLISELEVLEDISDSLIFEDEPSIFTEEYAVEFVETAMHLIDEYIEYNPNIISEPDFKDIILEDIKDIFCIQIEDYNFNSIYYIDDVEDVEDDMNELLEEAFNIYITTFHQDKSINIKDIQYDELNTEEILLIERKIQGLREIPQPIQRTPEWYKFRWNLITASNAWKAFESQLTINQLIYEKCQPLKEESSVDQNKTVNINSPLHWGQKYEPLSVLIYEQKYNTKVEDFGCIQHPLYKFLGASPDGIVVNKESERYGRMLEIKNVVSREITGIPKKEYWTQMQLQMEVCDLDNCDFLETKFTEYTDFESYEKDVCEYHDIHCHTNNICISKDNKIKGEIIYFNTKNGQPFYVYKPLDCIHFSDIQYWSDNIIQLYENEPYNYTFIKTIYWKLEVLSCVLVLRKREWFKNNIGQLETVWKIIENERITGYEHRAPMKKQKKDTPKPFINTQTSGCLLNFDKIIKVDTKM